MPQKLEIDILELIAVYNDELNIFDYSITMSYPKKEHGSRWEPPDDDKAYSELPEAVSDAC